MADFDLFSDTDDSAVDELISQIQDFSVLEQVSKINTSGFTDSLLPSHLENRFQKLKSNSFSSSSNTQIFSQNKPFPAEKINAKQNPAEEEEEHPDGEKIKSFKEAIQNSDEEFSLDYEGDENPDWENELIKENKSKSKSGSLGSSSSSMDSPSPPHKGGCFWFSPKKKVPKKKKIKDDNLMEVLRSFSGKEGEKILKKAMEEEEKINREAKKILKLASKRESF